MQNVTRFPILVGCCFLFCLAGLHGRANAQQRLQTATMLHLPNPVNSPLIYQTQHSLFPKHIQQNPMGYASLCRMELKIEKQLPVGIWMRADGATYRQVSNPGLAYLRLKIPISASK